MLSLSAFGNDGTGKNRSGCESKTCIAFHIRHSVAVRTYETKGNHPRADHFTQAQPPEAEAVEAQHTGRAETEAVGQTLRQAAAG